MEISSFTIYLISITDAIKFTIGLTSFCFSLALLLVGIFNLDKDHVFDKVVKHPLYKKVFISSIIVCILSLFIPSSKTIIAMYTIPKITNNEKIIGITDNSLTILKQMTDDWIKKYVVSDKEEK